MRTPSAILLLSVLFASPVGFAATPPLPLNRIRLLADELGWREVGDQSSGLVRSNPARRDEKLDGLPAWSKDTDAFVSSRTNARHRLPVASVAPGKGGTPAEAT